jgi:hypothetical protein
LGIFGGADFVNIDVDCITFQRSRSLISSQDIPFAAADTVAHLRWEWPENPVVEMPARRSNSLTLSTRYCLLNKSIVQEKMSCDGSRGKRNKDSGVQRQDRGEAGEAGKAASSIATPCLKRSVWMTAIKTSVST